LIALRTHQHREASGANFELIRSHPRGAVVELDADEVL
jgi:hypothetical protein